MRHDIPGGWVEIRDVDEVPERLWRPVRQKSFQLSKYRAIRRQAQLRAQGLPSPADLEDDAVQEMADGAAELMDEITRLTILARVADWSFGPVDAEHVDDLPTGAYREIGKLADGAPVEEDLGPSDDTASPTGPSTD